MVFYAGFDRIFVAQETMEGVLIDSIEKAAGDGGFGYDPIFMLPQYGLSTAEISPELKNELSHRGKALRLMKEKLKEVFISVVVLKKDLEVVIEQINNPLLSKDYLANNNQIGI